jgi:hypothetical protein
MVGGQRRGARAPRVAAAVAVVMVAAVAAGVGTAAPGLAAGPPAGQVCPELDGKVDVKGSVKTLTLTAPAGFVIAGYCVKAGSTRRGNGPELVTVEPPQRSVVIAHSSGKDISHWSWTLVPEAAVVTTIPAAPPVTDGSTTTAPPTTAPVPSGPSTSDGDTTTVPPTSGPAPTAASTSVPASSVPAATGAIGDRAWFDTDGNGRQDGGEPGLEWVGVTLLATDGSPARGSDGLAIRAMFTDATGTYRFTGVPDGTYLVQFDTDCSFVPTLVDAGDDGLDSDAAPSGTGGARCLAVTGPVTVAGGAETAAVDFGVVPATATEPSPPTSPTPTPAPPAPSGLGDRVWVDENANGMQDDGEPGLAGVGATLLTADGSPAVDVAGQPVPSRVTDDSGGYRFADLPAGRYRLLFDTDCSYEPTAANAVADDALDSDVVPSISVGGRCLATTGIIDLGPGASDPSVDAGVVGVAAPPEPPPAPGAVALGGRAWFDANQNGRQDDGEPGIQWVGVGITRADGSPVVDASGAAVTKAYTDAVGSYRFENLLPGTYVLRFDADEGAFRYTVPNAGDDVVDSDATEAGIDPAGSPYRRVYAGAGPVEVVAGTAAVDVGLVTNPVKFLGD